MPFDLGPLYDTDKKIRLGSLIEVIARAGMDEIIMRDRILSGDFIVNGHCISNPDSDVWLFNLDELGPVTLIFDGDKWVTLLRDHRDSH